MSWITVAVIVVVAMLAGVVGRARLGRYLPRSSTGVAEVPVIPVVDLDPLEEAFRDLEVEVWQRDCEHDWMDVSVVGRPRERVCRACGKVSATEPNVW